MTSRSGAAILIPSPGDLVAHAGVAILHLIPLHVLGAPHLVQVARHRACCTHHHVTRTRKVVHRADHLTLPWDSAHIATQVVCRRNLTVPSRRQIVGLTHVGRVCPPSCELSRQCLQCFPSICHDGQARKLMPIQVRHVDVDEPGARVCAGTHGGRGEVAPSGADAHHEIGFGG